MCWLSWNLWASTSWNPLGLSRSVQGLLCLSPSTLKFKATQWPKYWYLSIRLRGSMPQNTTNCKFCCCDITQTSNNSHIFTNNLRTLVQKGYFRTFGISSKLTFLVFFYIWVSVHHKSIMYNKPTRCNSGSIVFINNYRYALHVSDALSVHHQEHYKLCSVDLGTSIQDLFHPNSWQTPVAAVTVYSAPDDGRKGRPKHVEHTCSF